MTDERFSGIDQAVPLSTLLGWLNFSEGKPDPRFAKQLQDAYAFVAERGAEKPWDDLRIVLIDRLHALKDAGGAAFTDIGQARARSWSP